MNEKYYECLEEGVYFFNLGIKEILRENMVFELFVEYGQDLELERKGKDILGVGEKSKGKEIRS